MFPLVYNELFTFTEGACPLSFSITIFILYPIMNKTNNWLLCFSFLLSSI